MKLGFERVRTRPASCKGCAQTLIERAEAVQLSGTSLLTARQVQRLQQGMGRATRSNKDYCVVFLLGARLAGRLHGPAARASFSPATRAQIELSEEVGDLIEGTEAGTLRQVGQQCLDRDPDWLAASRGRLATLRYGDAVVTPFATGTRAAFEHAAAKDYPGGVAELQRAVNVADDPAVKAYLKQQLAAYQHHLDPAAAQQTQKSANAVTHGRAGRRRRVPRPRQSRQAPDSAPPDRRHLLECIHAISDFGSVAGSLKNQRYRAGRPARVAGRCRGTMLRKCDFLRWDPGTMMTGIGVGNEYTVWVLLRSFQGFMTTFGDEYSQGGLFLLRCLPFVPMDSRLMSSPTLTLKRQCAGLAGGGYSRARAADATAAQRQAWLTLIDFARIIVVIVALTSAVLKRAARK